ncbi:hypothetical protein [Agrococcus sp. HG114]|uniref:hypothetical protein n=1 Tax=Agrococcus sp. HG114 TaxID=2969757 RepID=UPI00215B7416|nr:hypothetical protein [Agrococcus sp. HG114]MCR8670031.1 hypothetical protein [Agrococcus sp. HG114]
MVVQLEEEPPGAAVREDVTYDESWEWDDFDLSIVEDREDLEIDGSPPQREGEREIELDPFGPWALDEQARAFRVELGVDDETGLVWLHAASVYGSSLHRGIYDAAVLDTAAGEAAQELQLYLYAGYPDEPYERWLVGSRAAIEQAAPAPLPDFDPGEWMRWVTPIDGGPPLACGGFLYPDKRAIALEPLGSRLPAWAQGRALTIPMPRPGEDFGAQREVTVYGKPFAELRSSTAKVQKRPPTPIGRFVLEAEGFMPAGWSALG